jgi:hypothetical protein
MGRIYEYSIEEQRILFPEKFITSEKKVNTSYEDDYRGKTGRTVRRKITRNLKDSDDVFRILDIIYDAIKSLADMIIFDINNVSDKKVSEVRDLFKSHQFGYSELGVYEDTHLVFAAMDIDLEEEEK